MIYQVFVHYDSQACAKATRVMEQRCTDCWTKQLNAAVAATIYRIQVRIHFKIIQSNTSDPVQQSPRTLDEGATWERKRDGLKIIEKRGNGKKRNDIE